MSSVCFLCFIFSDVNLNSVFSLIFVLSSRCSFTVVFKISIRDFSSQMKLETASYETNCKLSLFTTGDWILKMYSLCTNINIKVRVETFLLTVPGSDRELSLKILDILFVFISCCWIFFWVAAGEIVCELKYICFIYNLISAHAF